MLTIHLDSPVPIERQIYAGIRQFIASGDLQAGDELPTVRQVAADLGVNLNTVARAYRLLDADGLVHTVRGRGTTVAANRERPRGTPEDTRARIRDGLGSALADARLAGLSRRQVEALVRRLLGGYWPAAAGR